MRKQLLVMVLLLLGTAAAYNTQTFTANGTYTVPGNTSYIYVEAWGAGGDGATIAGSSGGGGGGGGAYVSSVFTVTPGATYNITVGQHGGASWFNTSASLRANGGGNGSGTTAGSGGTAAASVGQTKHSGGNGGVGTVGPNYPGSGGGAGGTIEDGDNGANSGGAVTQGGAGGLYDGGAGGAVPDSSGSGAPGGAGTSPGGGGGGAWRGAGATQSGGAGADGLVRIYSAEQNFSLVTFNIKNIVTTAYVTGPTNITLQSPTNFITYRFNTTTGVYSSLIIEPGLYTVQISSENYSITYALINVAADTDQNATFYVDSAAQPRVFTVQDTLGNLVVNASVSFARNVGGTVVVVVQAITDFTGFFTVNLDPNTIYSVTATEPSGVYSNFSGAILASDAATTYLIRMLFSSAASTYPAAYNNTFASPGATYNNTTQTINVTWEVIAGNADLVYWSANTTYNGTPYLVNRTSPAAGGIASFNITGVDLSVQNTIYVRFQFLRTGFDPVSFTLPFQFTDVAPGNYTVSGSDGLWSKLPLNTVGRVLVGMLILLFVIAGTYQITSNPTAAAFMGIVLTGLFTVPAVNVFPLVPGLITIAVLIVVIISDEVSNR